VGTVWESRDVGRRPHREFFGGAAAFRRLRARSYDEKGDLAGSRRRLLYLPE
jgi:hypothetical protein